jgi:5'-methylthioadenosine phosphorylase
MRIAIIGGTGPGEALLEGMAPAGVEEHVVETPFGPPSSPVVTGMYGDVPIALLQRHGAGHLRNPRAVPYRANVFALKMLGCTHVIASGATGSLREEIIPGHVVLCDQLIDKTNGRSTTFYEHAAVHVEFADPVCPVMHSWLVDAAHRARVTVHEEGTYLCMEGPSFSTRAESHIHRQWGADVVGMTALPEARLAREAELAYALLALPTDYDSWRPRSERSSGTSLLEEIMDNLRHATRASVDLIRTALEDVTALRAEPSPAHDALALAIWSDRSAIDPAEIERLWPLWGRCFV